MIYNHSEIIELDSRFRTNLINSIGGFKSLALIGTRSTSGNENLAVFSSVVHLGADPALCGIVIRPNEEKENTLGNIMQTKVYTINHVLSSFYKQAHQCSARYPSGISEFGEAGLHPEYVEGIFAPFVRESAIKFACEMVQKIDIELNNTFLIIGKIIRINVPDAFIGTNGFVDLEQAGTLTCSGIDSYHTTSKLARLSYAKVNKPIIEID